MLVRTKGNNLVSFVRTDGRSIFDSEGREWIRDGRQDVKGYAWNQAQAAYSMVCTLGAGETVETALLTKSDLQRVCRGTTAMVTPITPDELRYESIKFDYEVRQEVNNMMDDELEGILRVCHMGHKSTVSDPVEALRAHVYNKLHPPMEPEPIEEAPPKPTERAKERRTRNTPRPRKQEGSVSVALGEVSVLLTPKQLEFMERLSECPGFDGSPGVEYSVSAYATELEDSMNAMSVGAVVTTLREKSVLTTSKRSIGGIRGSVFMLTPLGVRVYNKLAGKEAEE